MEGTLALMGLIVLVLIAITEPENINDFNSNY